MGTMANNMAKLMKLLGWCPHDHDKILFKHMHTVHPPYLPALPIPPVLLLESSSHFVSSKMLSAGRSVERRASLSSGALVSSKT